MFRKLFRNFVELFEKSGYEETYLDGEPTEVTDAYKEFLGCIKDEVTEVERRGGLWLDEFFFPFGVLANKWSFSRAKYVEVFHIPVLHYGARTLYPCTIAGGMNTGYIFF